MFTEKEIFLRLIVAWFLGGLIGWERGMHDRPAGLRTHILVSIGSALIMVISLLMYYSIDGKGDPGRIAAQVVSGIGFLGAGTIIREGMNVKGLTTAASLWAVAGVGLACGAGFYFGAFVTTGLIFVTLVFLNKIEIRRGAKGWKRILEVRALDRPGLLGNIGNILGEHGINIDNVSMDSQVDDECLLAVFQLSMPDEHESGRLKEQLLEIDGVKHLDWKNR